MINQPIMKQWKIEQSKAKKKNILIDHRPHETTINKNRVLNKKHL